MRGGGGRGAKRQPCGTIAQQLTSFRSSLSLTAPVEFHPLGVYIVRGDNLAVMGELDEAMDAKRDLGSVRAEGVAPIVHTQM